MEIKVEDLSKFPEKVPVKAHGKHFLIVRHAVTLDVSSTIDLSFWIYIQKRFLFWNYWSSLCQRSAIVSKDTVEEAVNFIEKYYPYMTQVSYYSYGD